MTYTKFLFAALLVLCLLAAMPASASHAELETLWMEETEIIVLDDEGIDSAEAAAGYVNRHLYPPRLMAPRLTGLKLPEGSRSLYIILREVIAQVADGELSSTVFTIPLTEFMEQTAFTAEELGVESVSQETITVDEDGTETCKITPDDTAYNAAKAKVSAAYNATDIIRALLVDSPYELYWYDKTTGAGCKVVRGMSCRVQLADEENEETLVLSGYLRFSFSVAPEYSTGTDYKMDTSFGEGAQVARANALAIMQKYEACSDYDRLLGYKNEICDLVSYNSAALDWDIYGNPWQLIWVFDGDPDTNVVCEGYAKAFQYLNDLSSSSVTVISPQGYIGDEAHMWNIVTMENGLNYLVDVTNCDSGCVGYPEKLFLVGSNDVDALGLKYKLSTNPYSTAELTLAARGYLHHVDYQLGSEKGYVGFSVTVMAEGELHLLPLTEVGQQTFTLTAMRDEVSVDFDVTIQVKAIGEADFIVPVVTEMIEEEAFTGISATHVVVPDCHIGARAFADNKNLQLVELQGMDLEDSAFEGCENVILAFPADGDPSYGFEYGMPFLIRE